MLENILKRYALFCKECGNELNTVGFGKEVDQLKCMICKKEYLFYDGLSRQVRQFL
ncbi:hypothetical protein GCM10010913_44650 [Paenibacillus aceti]|uniref:Inhibitor of sigma-G Gin n=1 Tax=Paenibacillus aceti TaxID=1820010 RepID=A0ABQ1W875_9BACL|nr:hypothetical protein GCM10010913_44650 [Paenibacillus aceti]